MAATLLIALLAWLATPGAQGDPFAQSFTVPRPSEAVATVRARCMACDWGAEGREAAALRITVDGRYSQHLLLSRGDAAADYRITLGRLAPGTHRLVLERDPMLSAKGAGAAVVERADVALLFDDTSDEATAQSMAPILHARANTIGRFTDLPLVMWYEIVRTERGREFRYSVIFSNEDGGTATDRLMATWGRTTDIEFVYGVEVDGAGRVLREEYQGPGHEVPSFKGQHEARHPLEWVATDNNMVSDSGSTDIRYAPAPIRFDLHDRSREAVMDDQPWIYAVMAREMQREGKVDDDAPPGHNVIPDPRRFLYVEACGEVGSAALALAVGVQRGGGIDWIPSDRGMPQYRIVRDGCFRIATPLPPGTDPADIRAIRVIAYERDADARLKPSRYDNGVDGNRSARALAERVHLTRINKAFMLDENYVPRQSILTWSGDAAIAPGGPPLEIPIP